MLLRITQRCNHAVLLHLPAVFNLTVFAVQDVTTVWARVPAAAVVHDSAEGRALSPSRARSPSPVKESSLAAEKLKNSHAADPAAVSFHVVVEVSLSSTIQSVEYRTAFVPVPNCKTCSLPDRQKTVFLCCSFCSCCAALSAW